MSKHIFLTVLGVILLSFQSSYLYAIPYIQHLDAYFIGALFLALVLPQKESWWYFVLGALGAAAYSFMGVATHVSIWMLVFALIRLLQVKVFSDFSLYSTIVIVIIATLAMELLPIFAAYARTLVFTEEYSIVLTSERLIRIGATLLMHVVTATIIFVIMARVTKLLNRAFIRR